MPDQKPDAVVQPTPATLIPLSEAQQRAAQEWAEDDRLWTTQETVEINLRTFARLILKLAVREVPSLATPATLREAGTERRLREYLCFSHGHSGQYGDDGELQCGQCAPFGQWDYRRAPLSDLIDLLEKVGHARMVQALAAREAPVHPPVGDGEPR